MSRRRSSAPAGERLRLDRDIVAEIGLGNPFVRQHRLRSALCDDDAEVENRHLLANRSDELHVMLDQQHRAAEARRDLANPVREERRLRGAEAGEREAVMPPGAVPSK